MRVSQLTQSWGLRRSTGPGRAAGRHARVMHTLLGTGGGQGLMDGGDGMMVAECVSADTNAADWAGGSVAGSVPAVLRPAALWDTEQTI